MESIPEGAHSAIDWAMRPLSPSQPQRLFDRLAGPGATHWESLVTALAMIGTCWFAHVSADEVRIHKGVGWVGACVFALRCLSPSFMFGGALCCSRACLLDYIERALPPPARTGCLSLVSPFYHSYALTAAPFGYAPPSLPPLLSCCLLAPPEPPMLQSWTLRQYGLALFIASIDGPAAIQCSTASSKRWYHAGGRMPRHLIAVITIEMAFQCALVGYMFTSEPFCAVVQMWLWYGLALAVQMSVPLQIQRPTSILILLATLAQVSLAADSAGSCVATGGAGGVGAVSSVGESIALPWFWPCGGASGDGAWFSTMARLPAIPGLTWFHAVFTAKYFVSHLPRHEPYR